MLNCTEPKKKRKKEGCPPRFVCLPTHKTLIKNTKTRCIRAVKKPLPAPGRFTGNLSADATRKRQETGRANYSLQLTRSEASRGKRCEHSASRSEINRHRTESGEAGTLTKRIRRGRFQVAESSGQDFDRMLRGRGSGRRI